MNLHDLIEQAAFAWITQEKANAQSLPGQITRHIEKTGKLRLPQRQAIEIYLWLKFVGQNRALAEIIRAGALRDQTDGHRALCGNATAEFLYRFAKANELHKLGEMVKDDPLGTNQDWNTFLDALLHYFNYPNYLFSLPMGAGKTYLMAAFIYLDLHFARLQPNNPRFARNFILFAPQASKTAILPSLQTIRNFDPTWVLPPNDAAELRRVVHFEILDNLSSKRRDKLHGNNPNLEKVNRLTQTRDFGLVFITNAEKVVMEKLSPQDQQIADPASLFYDEKKASEVVKTNALREKLSQIPGISVILDEAHHFFTSSGDDEKKLKLAVDVLNQHRHVCAVLGFSGTPYLKHHVPLAGSKVKLSQIQLITYHYSLADGIGRFLKVPEVIGKNVAAREFVRSALAHFFAKYDRIYPDGTPSKIAFYCADKRHLNEEIYSAVLDWYATNRPGKSDDETFRFYTDIKKGDPKTWKLSKESGVIFNNLDQPHIRKRVILLVAIGTEGWDCRSLTSVALPRKNSKERFVLQTTCRCLREVVSAKDETAFIQLGEGNYEILDEQLRKDQQISIADLRVHAEQTINVLVRKPKLGKLRFKNVRRRYSIIREERDRDVAAQLASFDFGLFKTKNPFTPTATEATVGKRGLASAVTHILAAESARHHLAYADLLSALAGATWGRFSEADLVQEHDAALRGIHAQIQAQIGWLALHPALSLDDVVAFAAALLMENISVTHDEIEEDVEIDLLDWRMNPPAIPHLAGGFLPEFRAGEISRFNQFPNRWEEEIKFNHLDDHDVTFNYAPYAFDSRYEVDALRELSKLAEMLKLEFYYNGYRNGNLQALVIRTPYGNYTPDFLVLKRKPAHTPYRRQEDYAPDAIAGPIDRVLILETKGKRFYDADFQAKEKFIKDVFLQHNPHFRYKCLVDQDDNDFSRHLETVKQEIQNL
jgi:hypothetical protein